ncbi:hypothetical protein AXF42_Ash008724 [Apostasia shenzhenica]|uniref:SAWADEE domain-containing protein n=1 Tax=Apostasia shenzhenica TaxID=1088818 RepID=A0A2I0B288_9ASPA|nr:hypothetical protein AXF42_Ash008724 [Apostasia shenzhenica]
MALNFVDAMELESMRENDCSWRPCRISLRPSSSRTGIIVDFGSGAEDEFIYDQKDALSRLRFRSVPLQSDDCVHIKEGEHVLALQKTRFKSLFYDATIVEPKRVKHSKRVHCRCTFEIKWLNSERKGEIMIVPSQLILRLSDRSIEEHPVFTDFLKNLKSGSGGEGPSFLSFPEGSKCEADIVGILEKQVEQISKLFDGPKQTYTDLFSMVEDAKQDEESVFSTASTKAIFEISAVNNSKIHQAIVAQKESEDKPVLTPLAARAALASLVHELPAKILCFSAEQTLKHKGLQEMDLSETIELPSFGAITSSTKSYYLLQNEKEAKPSRKLHGNKEDEHVILKNSRNSVNGEKLKVPASSRRITRSMLKTFADGNRSLQNRDISSDYPKGVHEMSSSSSDDFLDEIESTENSKIISQDLASSDNYGSKEKKSASVIMVRQIDSTPERKEPARKKRNRTPSDDAQGKKTH